MFAVTWKCLLHQHMALVLMVLVAFTPNNAMATIATVQMCGGGGLSINHAYGRLASLMNYVVPADDHQTCTYVFEQTLDRASVFVPIDDFVFFAFDLACLDPHITSELSLVWNETLNGKKRNVKCDGSIIVAYHKISLDRLAADQHQFPPAAQTCAVWRISAKSSQPWGVRVHGKHVSSVGMQVGTPIIQYNIHAHWTRPADAGAALFWSIRAIVWLATLFAGVRKLHQERNKKRIRAVFVLSSSLSISTHFVASLLNLIWGIQQCNVSAFGTWFIQQTVAGQLVPMTVYVIAFKFTHIIPASNVQVGFVIICFSVVYLPLFGGGCYVGSVTSVIASTTMIITVYKKKANIDACNNVTFHHPTAASNATGSIETLAASVSSI
jgi:hypothetical protein